MKKTRAVVLSTLVVLGTLPITAAFRDPGSASRADAPKEPVDDPAAVPARSDCSFSGTADPDGRERRKIAAIDTASFVKQREAQGIVVGGGGPITPKVRRVNFIDDEIFGAMEQAGIPSAPLAGDEEFLRRVTLDLTGRIPDVATLNAFLADRSADKRDRAIDRLLASDAFVDRWAFFYDELFRNTAAADNGRQYGPGRNAFHQYFVDSVRSRKPYDVMTRELITATGDSHLATGAATNFEVRNLQPNGPRQDSYDNAAASVGQVFLGTNIFCSSCHNGAGHTDQINIWLSGVDRSEFWGMAAFFARTFPRRQGTQDTYFYYTTTDAGTGEYQLNTTTGNKSPRDPSMAGGQTFIRPAYLSGGAPMQGETYRAALARLLTADDQFARASVNYLWKELFTVGIVEPANDFDLARQDPSNPPPAPWTVQPSHPALLTKLATEYKKGFDLRTILKTITRSSAYQLSSYYPGMWSEAYAPFYARKFVRRLRAEEVYDAISMATGVFYNLPVGGYTNPIQWAGQLPDTIGEPGGRAANGMNQGNPTSTAARAFLDNFLRGDREENARSNQGSILQALLLMNDKVVVTDRTKGSNPASTVAKVSAGGVTPTQAVTTLYLTTLSRNPTAQELADGVTKLTVLPAGTDRRAATEDLQYVLLNKLDFIFNY